MPTVPKVIDFEYTSVKDPTDKWSWTIRAVELPEVYSSLRVLRRTARDRAIGNLELTGKWKVSVKRSGKRNLVRFNISLPGAYYRLPDE